MKGIVLAGGTGSRLWPITRSVSKQLLPVYDKPMIYYPISTLMLAGAREILIITTPQDLLAFKNLLGDGTDFGISIEYATQPKPEGIAQALIIGENFLNGECCLLILGDNIFHGVGLGSQLSELDKIQGSMIFTFEVNDPSQYGILTLDPSGEIMSIVEKPKHTNSNLAITGMYFFDGQVSNIARLVKPSERGELEITSVLEYYMELGQLNHTHLSRGTTWLDTGNPNALNDACNFVRLIEERSGLKIGCPEEIGLKNGWVDPAELRNKVSDLTSSGYFNYLIKIIDERI